MYVADSPEPPFIFIGNDPVEFVTCFWTQHFRISATYTPRSTQYEDWLQVFRLHERRPVISCAWSVLLYEALMWRLKTPSLSRVNRLDSLATKTIEGVNRYNLLSNEKLHQMNGQTSTPFIFAQRRLFWLSHVLRRPPQAHCWWWCGGNARTTPALLSLKLEAWR